MVFITRLQSPGCCVYSQVCSINFTTFIGDNSLGSHLRCGQVGKKQIIQTMQEEKFKLSKKLQQKKLTRNYEDFFVLCGVNSHFILVIRETVPSQNSDMGEKTLSVLEH